MVVLLMILTMIGVLLAVVGGLILFCTLFFYEKGEGQVILVGGLLTVAGMSLLIVFAISDPYYGSVVRMKNGWAFQGCYISDAQTPGGRQDKKMYEFRTVGALGFKRPMVCWSQEALPLKMEICEIIDRDSKTLAVRDGKCTRVIKWDGKVKKILVPRDNWMGRWTMPASQAWIYEDNPGHVLPEDGHLVEWVAK